MSHASRFSKAMMYGAAGLIGVHLLVATFVKASYTLTVFGDVLPCLLLLLSILTFHENFRRTTGVLSLFWELNAIGLLLLFISQSFWIYYDTMRLTGAPSPVFGDSLFLLAHVFFLAALSLRPHCLSAARDLRFRKLDFSLLTLWWFSLYAYFGLPWQFVIFSVPKYTPTFYVLTFIQHLAILSALAVLWSRNTGLWRSFYLNLFVVFTLLASGNLLLSIAIDQSFYYAGGFLDTPFLVGLALLPRVATIGARLVPYEDRTPNREIRQGIWTARIAMIAILTLPVIALVGFFEKGIPQAVSTFRLELVFGAMLLLGALIFLKLHLISRELKHLVGLSQASIENLHTVQERISQSQKLAALGRLAAGATHEISNPLTAILGYSELLADLPNLNSEDREYAQTIRMQVHRAQAAVTSLRNTLKANTPSVPTRLENSQSS